MTIPATPGLVKIIGSDGAMTTLNFTDKGVDINNPADIKNPGAVITISAQITSVSFDPKPEGAGDDAPEETGNGD